jgi:site-specific DNA recombinase
VQDIFAGRHKPRHRKHNFAFAGLLRCAYDGCTVTTELQKGRYVYYRCSHGRGKCSLPYMREQDLSDHLGDLLKGIYVPEGIAEQIVGSLDADRERSEAQRQERLTGIEQRLAAVRTRMDQIYEDKLEGKIDESFWARKQADYREQERVLEAGLSGAKASVSADVLTVKKIFELASKAHFLYLTRNLADRGQLLKYVLLNCTTDGATLTPTYRKPFDLIFERAEDWSGREDLNLRPPGPEL